MGAFEQLEYDWKAQGQPRVMLILLWKCLKLALRLLLFTIVVLKIPFFGRKINDLIEDYNQRISPKGTQINISYKTLISQIRTKSTEMFRRSAIVGNAAPNLKLVEVKTERVMELLNFQKPGRPLIVNFGSCT